MSLLQAGGAAPRVIAKFVTPLTARGKRSTGDFLQGGSPKAETWLQTALSPQPGLVIFGEGLAWGQTHPPSISQRFPRGAELGLPTQQSVLSEALTLAHLQSF